MTTKQNRRRFLCLGGGVVSVLTAGCLGNSSDGPEGEQTPETTSGETTISESEISDEDARTQALNAEEAYLREQLSNATCLDNWGTTETTAHKEASATERTAEGVIVEVTHPWWYSRTWTEEGSDVTQETNADGASNAEYLVTPVDTERLSGGDVSPC